MFSRREHETPRTPTQQQKHDGRRTEPNGKGEEGARRVGRGDLRERASTGTEHPDLPTDEQWELATVAHASRTGGVGRCLGTGASLLAHLPEQLDACKAQLIPPG